ncbi:tetratricopeptide repeat protein [Tepidibacter formicigenes]|jgi:tetratricopeptide (TPR) repeat protein|uniref:Tetratricopeptide repeat-containing protein n=1 Tax=Tepidibacter formicigenes DSM 15518 TaxID=1123349 RepID=A0A1M6P904_9FIRM|nr:tetratricopeptide repeat protein [Tepidibacter formicigenes]SHK04445.1 Tetratricopeptide repeat-containing protein [Tepidibacter formicigenes DSM 15518]
MEILSLGEKIKKLRKEKNLTLKELAGNRITAAQISHIERDKSYPSQDLLEYFVEKLDVSIDYLLESKDMQAKKISNNLLIKGEIYIKSDELEEAKKEIKKVIEICKEYKLYENYGKAKFLLGLIYFNEKNYELAIDNFERSLVLNVKTSNFEKVVQCYLELGKVYLEEGFYKVALDKLTQGENLFLEYEMKNNEIKKELYTYMSYCYIKLEDNVRSLKYAKKIHEIEENEKNIKEKANSLFLIGSNLLDMGKWDESKEYLNKALKIYEEENKKNEFAKTQVAMSKIYTKLGKYEDALECVKKAYITKREYEDKEVIKVLFEYVKVLINTNDFENAKKYAKKALVTSIKIKDKKLEYKSLKYYAKIYKKEGDLNTAIEHLKKCLYIIEELGDKKELADLYIELAQTYSKISKEKELEYYTKGIEIYKDLDIIEK